MMTRILDGVIKGLLYLIAFSIPLISSYDIILGMIFVLVVLVTFNYKQYDRMTYALRRNGFMLTAFIVVLVCGTVFSVAPKDSLDELVKYFAALLLMIIIQWVLTKKSEIFLFIQVLVVSSTMIAAYGIVQYFRGSTVTYLLVDTELHPDIDIRVTSLMQNSNNLAFFLCLVIPLLFSIIIYKKHWFHKLAGLGALGIMGACLVITYSRSGYIGFAVAAAGFMVLVEPRLLLSLPVLGGIGSVWMPKGLESRLSSLVDTAVRYLQDPTTVRDSSAGYRIDIWEGASRTFESFKVFGTGIGHKAFSKAYTYYAVPETLAQHAHNVFLELLIEFGILGFIVFFGFIITVIWYSYKMKMNTKSQFINLFTTSIGVAVVGFFISGFVEHVLYYYKVFFTFFVLLGLLMALYNNEYRNRASAE